MQTATLYTLNSKVVPVYGNESVVMRYMTPQEMTPLNVEGEPTMFTHASYTKEYLPTHEVYTTFRSIRWDPEIPPPEPWKFLNYREDPRSGDRLNTYHHLFSVDPELEKILRHVFNSDLTDANRKNEELTQELNLTRKDYLQLSQRVDYFRKCNVFRRLLIAFCNDITP